MTARDAFLLAAKHNGGVLFGEAAQIVGKNSQINSDSRVPVSARSILMSERAQKIQRERGCDFGLALKLAREEMQYE
jgi:hypothetical protein